MKLPTCSAWHVSLDGMPGLWTSLGARKVPSTLLGSTVGILYSNDALAEETATHAQTTPHAERGGDNCAWTR